MKIEREQGDAWSNMSFWPTYYIIKDILIGVLDELNAKSTLNLYLAPCNYIFKPYIQSITSLG